MTYAEYKAVYIDKTVTLKDWQPHRTNNLLQESSSSATIISQNGNASKSQPMRAEDIKDIEDANNFAMNVLGIPRASYASCAVSVAKQWNERLQQVFQGFPELKKQIRFVGESHERNRLLEDELTRTFTQFFSHKHSVADFKDIERLAEAMTKLIMRHVGISEDSYAVSLYSTVPVIKNFNGITVNANYAKNVFELLGKLKNDVALKHHPVGCDTIKSLIDHEIAHQLDILLGISKKPEIQKLYRYLVTNKSSSSDYAKITDELSEYAGRSCSEFVAEAWAEYCNNRPPRIIAKTIGEIIESEYAKKFQRRTDWQ